jgi:exonuclease SbcC
MIKKTSEELIALYDQKKEILDLLKSEINDLNIEKIKLESEHDNCSALEYEEEIQILTLQKEQKIRKAKDLTRIQEKLNEIINRAPADPYEGYYNKMRSYMNTLTVGKYQDLAIDDALPTAIVQQNNRHIGLDLLSQGTSTLLGIALRLSMADYFLGERGGFLVFDDPMTDLDESRQQATANCFLEYATENHRQVLVFTCHESHANQLAGNRIELN